MKFLLLRPPLVMPFMVIQASYHPLRTSRIIGCAAICHAASSPRVPSRPCLAAGEQLDLRQGREVGFDQLVEDGGLLGMFAARRMHEALPLRAVRRRGTFPLTATMRMLVLVAKPVTQANLVFDPDAMGSDT